MIYLSHFHQLIEFKVLLERNLIAVLCYLNLTQSCFKCNTVNCCGAIINGEAQCSHKKGCPFSLWIRRLYSMHEVEVVYDAAQFFMNEDVDDLGDETFECNLRVDTAPFNVNNRGGCLF